jgi:uncharacterized repeat protein (TIGR02543 family)
MNCRIRLTLGLLVVLSIIASANVPPVRAIYPTGTIQWCRGISPTAQNVGTFSFAGGCITPLNPPTYSPTDAQAFFLAQLAGINGQYEFYTQWHDPAGDLCNECTHDSGLIDLSLVNAISISDSIQIAGRLPASHQGTWSVELLVNFPGGIVQSLATSTFTVSSPSTGPPPVPTFTASFTVSPGDAAANAGLTVDGQAVASGKQFTWNQGDQHTLSVKKTVTGATSDTQYVFTGWSDGVSDTTRTITVSSSAVYSAQYKTQYQLTVNSDYGSATGADWYDEGSKAFAVLDTSSTSDGLLYNWVFAGWTGDASGTDLKSNPIMMDSPKTATAKWNHEFSMIFYGIVVAVIAVVAVAGIMVMRRGRGPKTQQTQATRLSGHQKFCPHCHVVLPVEAAVCSSCGKPT